MKTKRAGEKETVFGHYARLDQWRETGLETRKKIEGILNQILKQLKKTIDWDKFSFDRERPNHQKLISQLDQLETKEAVFPCYIRTFPR